MKSLAELIFKYLFRFGEMIKIGNKSNINKINTIKILN